jgi:hypothetical protein
MFDDQPGDCDRLRNITLNLFVIVILHVIILEIYQVSNKVLYNNIDICFVTGTWLNDKIPSSLVHVPR